MTKLSWLSSIFIILACAASTAHAQTNGDFESTPDLAGWTVNGNVSIQTIDPDGSANNYAIFREPESGGLSRIRQSMNPPTGINPKIQFTFRISEPASRSTSVPPDSFTAFLIIEPPSGPDAYALSIATPSFIRGFLYADSDGLVLYSDSVQVSLNGDVFTVQVDLVGKRIRSH